MNRFLVLCRHRVAACGPTKHFFILAITMSCAPPADIASANDSRASATAAVANANKRTATQFALTALPPTLAIAVDGSSQTMSAATAKIQTTILAGPPGTISLSPPAGCDSFQCSSLSAQQVISGGAVKLTVKLSNNLPEPFVRLPFVISAQSGALTQDVVVDAVAIPPGVELLDNGSFTSGDFSSWTVTPAPDAADSVFSPTLSLETKQGGFAATLHGELYGNDATLSQTIEIPSTGSTTLAFWYKTVGCSLADSTVKMEIHDNSGGFLASVLNVCVAGDWTRMTADLTPYAGKSVQLWFASHDAEVELQDIFAINDTSR